MEGLRTANQKLLLIPKFLYFFTNLSYYTLYQFRGVFAQEMFHISKADLGRYSGVILFITFFTNIFIGAMNDKFDRSNVFLAGLIAVSCLIFQLFYVESYIESTPFMFWTNLLLYMTFNNGIPPILDKIVLEYLNTIPSVGANAYGKQRMWGTAGYTASTFLIERCVKHKKGYDFESLRTYSIVTSITAGILSVVLLRPSSGRIISQSPINRDICRNFIELIKNRPYLFFIFIIFLNGITRSSLTFYQTVYYSEILQLSPYDLPKDWPFLVRSTIGLLNNSPIGTTSLCATVLEMVVLYYTPWIHRRFGLLVPFFVAQVFQFIRIFCYYFLDFRSEHVFIYCCLIEFIKGIYFGLIHASAVKLAMEMSPAHLKSTSQVIYQGTFTALSSVVAGVICGQIFDKDKVEGGNMPIEEKARYFKSFFLINAGIAAATGILFAYKYFVLDNISRARGQEKVEENNEH
jgi:MFS family permease